MLILERWYTVRGLGSYATEVTVGQARVLSLV